MRRRIEMKRLSVVLAVLVLVSGSSAFAGQLAKGDWEFLFDFSYSKFSPDTGSDEKSTDITGRAGYLLTDAHEVGGVLEYGKDENGVSFDSTAFGAFYHYNFKAGTNMNPYVGAQYTFFGGDFGDFYESASGLTAGIKVYPWDNGGFNFGVLWENWSGEDFVEDADVTGLFGGVQLKY
jgi:hypothetical protein